MAQDAERQVEDDSHELEQVRNLENPSQMATEMAKAFQEITKGEETASALEQRLSGIEGRIEQLLAAAEETLRQQKSQDEPSSLDQKSDTSPDSKANKK